MNVPEQLSNPPEHRAEQGQKQTGPFKPGDLVEILPYEEIEKNLDTERRCGGLTFLRLMHQYCGRRAYVYKRVRMIYDERLQKMVKIRNTYLLEGIICDGKDFFSKEGCDKSCFLFWKDKWLRKVKE